MLSARQQTEASPAPAPDFIRDPPPACNEAETLFASQPYDGSTDGMGYFLGEVFDTLSNSLVTIDQLCAYIITVTA